MKYKVSSQLPERFETTRWSMVRRAGVSSENESRQALSELIELYWYPLYAFARRRGNPHHDAMDLTQSFVRRLLSGDVLSSVSQEKGRFRTFLMVSFKNFMTNQNRAATSIRRGGAVTTTSLSTQDFHNRYDLEPVHKETAESIFELSWVDAILARARNRLADEYRRVGKESLFETLEPLMTKGVDAVPRTEICRQLNLSSAAVSMSIHRMRRRFGELLRSEVAETLDESTDIDDEIRALMEIISRRS